MDRYYIIDNKPQLFSLLEFLNSLTEDGVLTTDQSQLERIIKMKVDESISFKQSSIKRVI